jgi:hypothetical protein
MNFGQSRALLLPVPGSGRGRVLTVHAVVDFCRPRAATANLLPLTNNHKD